MMVSSRKQRRSFRSQVRHAQRAGFLTSRICQHFPCIHRPRSLPQFSPDGFPEKFRPPTNPFELLKAHAASQLSGNLKGLCMLRVLEITHGIPIETQNHVSNGFVPLCRTRLSPTLQPRHVSPRRKILPSFCPHPPCIPYPSEQRTSERVQREVNQLFLCITSDLLLTHCTGSSQRLARVLQCVRKDQSGGGCKSRSTRLWVGEVLHRRS